MLWLWLALRIERRLFCIVVPTGSIRIGVWGFGVLTWRAWINHYGYKLLTYRFFSGSYQRSFTTMLPPPPPPPQTTEPPFSALPPATPTTEPPPTWNEDDEKIENCLREMVTFRLRTDSPKLQSGAGSQASSTDLNRPDSYRLFLLTCEHDLPLHSPDTEC